MNHYYSEVAVPRSGNLAVRFLKSLVKGSYRRPNYENALISGLKSCVQENDQVVVVGGGSGVTATIAAQLAAPHGRVICFEGGKDQVEKVRRTATANGVRDRLEVRHAFVGPNDHVYSDTSGAISVPIQDLPVCDVLELDCEGAEIEILAGMTIRPRSIIVESHGLYGAPSSTLRARLEEIGYKVTNLGVAEIDAEDFCIKNDIHVLMAMNNSAPHD